MLFRVQPRFSPLLFVLRCVWMGSVEVWMGSDPGASILLLLLTCLGVGYGKVPRYVPMVWHPWKRTLQVYNPGPTTAAAD